MRKPAFCVCENNGADQLCGSPAHRADDQRLCFHCTYVVQSLYFLNPKFQASSNLLWLYRLVCVRPGQIPEDRLSHGTAQIIFLVYLYPSHFAIFRKEMKKL